MTNDTPPSELERKLAQQLTTEGRSLDPSVERRLRQAKVAALEALDTPTRRFHRGWLAAAASVLVVAVLVARFAAGPQDTMAFDNASAEAMDDLDLLTADEDLELLEELEFFRWLSANNDDLS